MSSRSKDPAESPDIQLDLEKLNAAAAEGYFLVDEEDQEKEGGTSDTHELIGDVDLLTDAQKKSFHMLKESSKYPQYKVKRVSLSFSGASVFFMTPIREGGVPMPASVLKFDSKECVEDEMKKTEDYRLLFGSTTPQVKDFYLVEGEDPSSVMQIDLCGGVFGLPEFAKAPPVHTFASILEAELAEVTMTVDIIPILNEALERRMYHFTMSDRNIKSLSLADSYKIVRFVGHGILNRAKEGAKRAAKSPALAAGFQKPVEIDDLDPNGTIIQELCGRKQTVRDMFQHFSGMESKLSEKFKRQVVVGLCHNDLHGGNLLVDSQGLVWLIDFATVESGKHVLMDLSKFLSACTFMYLQDSVNEKHIQSIAKILCTTPDATTDLPVSLLDELKEDPVAKLFFQILVRIRHCMCLFESGPGSPDNDGIPFAIALFAWSARMQSYSEPTLFQKTRALYFAVAGVQRILWSMGEEIGPTASKWIEASLGKWEGQKGRRLSTSVAGERMAVPAYEFELEFQTYCAQAGSSEAWTTDILTREKVNVTEHCTELALQFAGTLNTRLACLPDKAKVLWAKVSKVYKKFAPDMLTLELFCGRSLVIGDGGTGKTVLTKQLLAEVAQMEVKELRDAAEAKKPSKEEKDPKSKAKPKKEPHQVMVPIRVPLVDISRQMAEAPDMMLEADVVLDPIAVWMSRKYGADSSLSQLIVQVRQASQVDEAQEDEAPSVADGSEDILGLFILLDGLDEAATKRGMILEYLKSLLETEPCHFPMLTSRPGVLGFAEQEQLAFLGFVACFMGRLSLQNCLGLAESILKRAREPESRIQKLLEIIGNPSYAGLTGNPMCLTLLTHVLRKFHVDSDDAILNKTSMYQRALKLMLHQADAAKFVSRDSEEDLKTVRQLEVLKGAKSRQFFQSLSWQGQTRRKRTFTFEEAQACTNDQELFEAFKASLSGGRLPAFTVSDGPSGAEIQLAHLSFQELLAAEYATAILQHSHKVNHMEAYFNFLSSSSLAAHGRDRLAEQWWLVVWINVAEMLNEESFQLWCRQIANDERAKLKVGRISYNPGRSAPKGTDPYQPKEVPFPLYSWKVSWMDAKARRIKLQQNPRKLDSVLDEAHVLPDVPLGMSEVLPIEAAHWPCEGVAALACFAVNHSNWRMLKALLESGIHPGICNATCQSVHTRCLANPDWTGVHILEENKVDINYLRADCLLDQQVRAANRFEHKEAAQVQPPSPAARQMEDIKESLAGTLQEAYAGTLQVAPGMDCDMIHASSGISLLMCAAAGGRSDLVAALLQSRANVNSRSSENCTALHFALDCAWGQGANTSVQLLLEARADPNARCGVTPASDWIVTGTGIMSACIPCMACDNVKLDLLLKHGYDATAKSDFGLSLLLWASLANSHNENCAGMVQRLMDLKCSYTDNLDPCRQRAPKQECWGLGVYDMNFQTISPDLLSWMVFNFHVSEVAWQKLLESVDVNKSHITARFLGFLTFYSAPMMFASFKTPLILRGDITSVKELVAAGFDPNLPYMTFDKSCVARLAVKLIGNGCDCYPMHTPLMQYQLPIPAYHAIWNKALPDLHSDRKKWPKVIRAIEHIVRNQYKNKTWIDAWDDWLMSRRVQESHA